MEPIISLEHVSKHFVLQHHRASSFQDAVVGYLKGKQSGSEVFYALRDVSFELREGESLGIIGRNGSGKSTILKVISRILEPNSGRVVVHGKVSALIELGAGFHPDLTGRENIFLYGSILGIRRREMARRFDNIVDFSELERFIDTPVKHYSSGMYARLGFAVAINVDPRILIVDEVLSVGDEAFQHKCLERIRELRGRGVSIVLVSHGLDTVSRFCDSVIWLDNGSIYASGAATEVVDAYRVASDVAADVQTISPASVRGERWGDDSVRVTSVELLDKQERQRASFVVGQAMTVRMRYVASDRVERPVFGIAIYTADGLHIAGPNSQAAGIDIEEIDGEGWVDCSIEALPLAPGDYDLSVAIYDNTLTHPFDHQHRAFRFHIAPSTMSQEFGLFRFQMVWQHKQECVLVPEGRS
jgi:ABC-type polysaccharide/polyol phosphate transport system ATPase subunit